MTGKERSGTRDKFEKKDETREKVLSVRDQIEISQERERERERERESKGRESKEKREAKDQLVSPV